MRLAPLRSPTSFMPRISFVTLLVLITALPAASRAASNKGASSLAAWEHSIVSVEVARKQYDYYQPWSKRTHKTVKTGTVVADHQILTTADEMHDRTLVRLQKGGRGQWFIGEVSWIDYQANLALIGVNDPEFWKDLKPAIFGHVPPSGGSLQILRWREGKLENRAAEFGQYTVREGQLTPVDVVALESSSEIQGVGWGEPLVYDSKVVGILWAQDGRTCIAEPALQVKDILEARKKGSFNGLGYFHFMWQQSENPANLARLKLPGPPRGVVVIDVPQRPDECDQVIHPQDILLNIDGFDIDSQGDYNDPDYGHLMLEALSNRHRSAGADVKMKIWRDGKPLDVTYRVPKSEYTNSLVPQAVYDREPEYLLVGGLLFQPLTEAYLQSWGRDWKTRAPFRLNFYRNEPASKDQPGLLLLSQVLPDAYNIGYQDQKFLVIEKANGQPVHRLSELREALQHPVNGFHVFEYTKGESLQRIVVAAGATEKEATARVLKRYGVTEESHFAAK
jgi:hypothetical protein